MSYNTMPEDHFDLAIVGAGLSGLMLAMALLENKATAGKKILLLDRSFQDYAPRTWCFWERGEGKFEQLVEKVWPAAEFFDGRHRLKIDLHPYAYKMIASERFRKMALDDIHGHINITLKTGIVEDLHKLHDRVIIRAGEHNYTASLVFDSRFDMKRLATCRGNTLYQQFTGWWVRCNKPVFECRTARLMDFRMEQQGSVAFCYLLPLDAQTALVEFTLFTPGIRPWKDLKAALQHYLATHFPDAGLEVRAHEEGVIPMADMPVLREHPRIIPIGTAAGCTKPSSGYTFMFVLEHTAAIIEALNKNAFPCSYTFRRRFRFYDRVLLQVLKDHPHRGAGIFFSLFKKNDARSVLDFMRDRSSFWQELKIFSKLPLRLFLSAAVRLAAGKWNYRRMISDKQ